LANKLDLLRLTSTQRRKSQRILTIDQKTDLESLRRSLLPELETVRECPESEIISPTKSVKVQNPFEP